MRADLRCGVVGLAVAFCWPSNAQVSEPAPSVGATAPTLHADEPSPGDIIVTARQREESILRVPVVATVLDQTLLEKQQIDDLYTVASRVPGFIFAESVGTVGIQTSLRGIGPTSQTPSVDQSVSLNVDGLQLTQGFAYAAALFDVGQVEILKGPQTLFFGKNSPAGVISLRSADPTSHFDLVSRAGYEFQANERFGELIVSGPVAETLKLRFAGRYSDMDGFFRNTANPLPGIGNLPPRYRDFSPRESWILRGTALWQPSEGYRARLKVNLVDERVDGNGGDGQLAFCPDGTGGVAPLNVAFIRDADCKLDRKTQLGDFDPAFFPGIRNNGVPFLDSRQYFGSLEQNVALGDELAFTSVSAYYNLRQDNLIRGSGSTNPTLAADFRFHIRQFTQEARLVSNFDNSPINFSVGAFYQDGYFANRNILRGNTFFRLPALLQSGRHQIDTTSYSAFGQLLWKLTDKVELAGGGRFTHEVRKHSEQNALAGFADVALLVPRIEANDFSPEVSLTYTPTDDLTFFGSYREGFKSGSFNTTVFIDSNTRADFGPERARGFEAGIKSRLLDRNLTFNIAAYRYIYSDLQVGANEISSTGGLILRTLNAASAKVQGIEADATYQPRAIRGLTLRGAVNYNQARYRRFGNAPCGNGQTIGEGCNQLLNATTGRFTSQDLNGRALVRAPNWTGNAGVDYETGIGSGRTVALGTNLTYSSRFYTNLVALPDYVQRRYAKLNANVAVRGVEDSWELALIGNNLTNKITAGLCSNSNTQNGTVFGGQLAGGPVKGPAGSDELGCVAERGREVLLRLTLRPSRLLGR